MWGTGLAEGPARGRAAHLGATRTWQCAAGRTRAGALALKHTLDLATHVEKHVDYLD